MTLPSELQYSSLPSLPSGSQSYEQFSLPVNGASFAVQSGNMLQFDLVSRGFLVPDSVYLSYKYAIASTGKTAIRCTPASAPIQRLETIFGSTTVESISNYNQVYNLMVASTYGVSDKYSNPNLGFKGTDGLIKGSIEYMDGRVCAANEVGSSSLPLSNTLLTGANKLIPLGMMPLVRVQLTLDSLSNIFTAAAPAITADTTTGTLASDAIVFPDSMTLTDVRLCYKIIDFGSEVDEVVKGMGEKIYIKSTSFTNSASVVPTNTSGTIDVVFNQRLASIKSLFLLASSAATSGVNGIFDSFNLSPRSEYSFNIAGKYYPPRPITVDNAQIELRKAVASLYDKNANSSINALEFSRTIGDTSTFIAPGKFFVGCNTEILSRYKHNDSSVLLSGVSTQSSPISVRINIPQPMAAQANLSLICMYDALLEIETATKSAYVRQ